MGSQQFCLKWNNHHTNIVTVFEELLSSEALVDVTLACDGLSLKAHKMVLSACSPFFQSLFVENPCKHPIVIMKDMKYVDLKAIVDFMYKGEVNISHDQMSAFLKTAETLRVKGLAMLSDEGQESEEDRRIIQPSNEPVSQLSTQFSKSSNLKIQKRKLGTLPSQRKRRTSHSSESSIDRTEEIMQTKVKERDSSPEIVEEASHDSSSGHTIIPQSKKSSVSSSQSEGLIPPPTLALTVSQTSSQRIMVEKQEKTSDAVVVFPKELSVYKEPVIPEQSVSESQSLLPFSIQEPVPGLLPSTTNSESFSLFPISSSNESQLIAPTSVTPMSSEASTSHNVEDITRDIKPSLVPYGEQIVSSPIDDSSHSQNQDSSNLNLFRSPLEHTSLSEPSTSQGNLQDQQHILQYQSEQQSAQSLVARISNAVISQGTSVKISSLREKPQCVICKKKFYNKQSLERHLELHQPNRKRYTCDICGKTCSHITDLSRHRTKHEEVFRYRCQVCSRTFVYQAALLKHLAEKHGNSLSSF